MLTIDDITPGAVLWLDPADLAADARITSNVPTVKFRVGPFLCVAYGPGTTTWISLTSRNRQRGERFLFDPAWWLNASPSWLATPCYANDLRECWIGRDVAFLDAARVSTHGSTCIRLNSDGLYEICRRMVSRRSLST